MIKLHSSVWLMKSLEEEFLLHFSKVTKFLAFHSSCEDLKNRFKATYGQRGKTALAYGMNEDFSRVMKNLIEYYSNNPNADRINRLKGEVDEVKTVMVQNIGNSFLPPLRSTNAMLYTLHREGIRTR